MSTFRLTRGPGSGTIDPSQSRFDQESAVAKHVGDVVVLLPGIVFPADV
jgi:hypothetical protein